MDRQLAQNLRILRTLSASGSNVKVEHLEPGSPRVTQRATKREKPKLNRFTMTPKQKSAKKKAQAKYRAKKRTEVVVLRNRVAVLEAQLDSVKERLYSNWSVTANLVSDGVANNLLIVNRSVGMHVHTGYDLSGMLYTEHMRAPQTQHSIGTIIQTWVNQTMTEPRPKYSSTMLAQRQFHDKWIWVEIRLCSITQNHTGGVEVVFVETLVDKAVKFGQTNSGGNHHPVQPPSAQASNAHTTGANSSTSQSQTPQSRVPRSPSDDIFQPTSRVPMAMMPDIDIMQ